MKLLSILFALFILIRACSTSEQKSDINNSSGLIEIENGWVRPGNAGMMTAAYFTINNGTNFADTLISINTDLAVDTQIHESYESGDGMMGMREIGKVPIDANSSAELKPGGIHIMIIRPSVDVIEGDSIDFNLYFSNLGELKIKLPVELPSN